MRTITAMFDSRAEAETARSRLAAAGISNDNVAIHDKTSLDGGGNGADAADIGQRSGGTHESEMRPASDYAVASPRFDPARGDANDGMHSTADGDYGDTGERRSAERGDRHDDDGRGVWDRIKAFFTGDDHVYEEGLRRGGYLLTARVEDRDAERAVDILDDEGTVDLDERQATWRSDGWQRSVENADDARSRRVRSYQRDNQRL